MDLEDYSGSGKLNHHKKANFPFHIVRRKSMNLTKDYTFFLNKLVCLNINKNANETQASTTSLKDNKYFLKPKYLL